MREYQFECPTVSAIGRERCRVPTDFALTDPLALPLNAVYAVSACHVQHAAMQHALHPMQHATSKTQSMHHAAVQHQRCGMQHQRCGMHHAARLCPLSALSPSTLSCEHRQHGTRPSVPQRHTMVLCRTALRCRAPTSLCTQDRVRRFLTVFPLRCHPHPLITHARIHMHGHAPTRTRTHAHTHLREGARSRARAHAHACSSGTGIWAGRCDPHRLLRYKCFKVQVLSGTSTGQCCRWRSSIWSWSAATHAPHSQV